VFQFHQPDTLAKWVEQPETLRSKLGKIPELNKERLRDAQFNAIKNLEISFKDNRPRALIQMATGAGKTFTACTFVYRLLKHAHAKRVFVCGGYQKSWRAGRTRIYQIPTHG